jgi:AcrR family transcriptional regulator
MPTSSLYEYFSGKSAILAAIYRRAADRVSGDASTILAANEEPAEAVTQLVDAYVDRSFASLNSPTSTTWSEATYRRRIAP